MKYELRIIYILLFIAALMGVISLTNVNEVENKNGECYDNHNRIINDMTCVTYEIQGVSLAYLVIGVLLIFISMILSLYIAISETNIK